MSKGERFLRFWFSQLFQRVLIGRKQNSPETVRMLKEAAAKVMHAAIERNLI